MARVHQTGFEIRTTSGPDGLSGTYTTSLQRSGASALSLTNAHGDCTLSFPGGPYSETFVRVAFRKTGNLSSWKSLIGTSATPVTRLDTDGKFGLRNAAGSFVGSTVTLSNDTWYLIEIRLQNTGSSTYAQLKVDGSLISSETISATGYNTSNWYLGAPSDTGIVFYYDDFAVNSTSGTVNNSWVGNGKVLLLKPVSDSSRTNWFDGAGGTTGLWNACDNTPPIGTASETALTQIESINDNLENQYNANLTTYTDAGIAAADTINAVQYWVCHGEDVSTGTKTGTFDGTNPDVTLVNFTYGNDAGALGTFPTNWAWSASEIVQQPSVVLGTSPLMTVNRQTDTTRVGSVCFMGAYVDYTPSVGTSYPYTGSGGATTGGSATTFKGNAYVGSGGATTGGTATCSLTQPTHLYTGSGGAVTGGSAITLKGNAYVGSGGAVTGGAATTSRSAAAVSHVYTGAGGATTAGAATTLLLRSFPYTGSGGALTGGTATTFLGNAYVGSGGAVTGGAAVTTHHFEWAYTGSGGALTGGASIYFEGNAYIGSGGALTGGAATTSRGAGELTYSWTGTGGALTGGAAVTLFIDVDAYVGSGGAVTGGTALVARGIAFVGSGGAVTGGAALTLQGNAYVGSGGAVTGGAATYFLTSTGSFVWIGSGGAITGGTAQALSIHTHPYTGTGGALTGGAAGYFQGDAYVGAGGAVTGGNATYSRGFAQQSHSWVGTGGALTGGTAATTHQFLWAYTGSGGAVTAGAAIYFQGDAYVGSGGAVTGGAAQCELETLDTYVWAGTGGAITGGEAVYYLTAVAAPSTGGKFRRWLTPFLA